MVVGRAAEGVFAARLRLDVSTIGPNRYKNTCQSSNAYRVKGRSVCGSHVVVGLAGGTGVVRVLVERKRHADAEAHCKSTLTVRYLGG